MVYHVFKVLLRIEKITGQGHALSIGNREMKKSSFGVMSLVFISSGLLLLAGCQDHKTRKVYNDDRYNNKSIKKLEKRLDEIEQYLFKNQNRKNTFLIKKRSQNGPIKSITLRLGSKDDRLRIYWENGDNSDLPCTKEQKIWVCG